MGKPHGIGIIGLGVISGRYLETLATRPEVRIVATADLDIERARAAAVGIPGCRALTPEELVADSEVETVLNLTTPGAHAAIALAAPAAGKNVYGEKPLAATFDDGLQVLGAASGAWVGAAPDTVLGTGIQTARRAIDDGQIGRPLSATATWVSPGHEAWHPHPDFYYRDGGGPLLDMGPYYLTSLVQMLGPVARVVGASSRTRSVRTIGSGPREGEQIPVEIATHVTGLLEHVNGAVSTVVVSFDAAKTTAAPIEVNGELGTLAVPDPNLFDGTVRLFSVGGKEWVDLSPGAGYVGAERGIGLLDFVWGDRRADGAIALHVLEIMTTLLDSARDGGWVALTTTTERPPIVPLTSEATWKKI